MKKFYLVACSLATAIALSASPVSASTLMLDFGPEAMTAVAPNPLFPAHFINSPLHQVGGLSLSETTWNTVGTVNLNITDVAAGAGSGLMFSDGSAAPAVGVNFGSFVGEIKGTIGDAAPATGQIDLAVNPDRSINFSSGVTGSNAGLFAAGAAGRDAIFNGTSSGALGVQVTGLAAGTYDVYVMGRNRNTGGTHDINAYAGAGTDGVNFDFDGYDSMAVSWTAGAVTDWVEGHAFGDSANDFENYSRLTVTLAAGEALNVGVDAGPDSTETRAFLGMLQITAVPEPSSIMLVGLGLLSFAFPGRKSSSRKC